MGSAMPKPRKAGYAAALFLEIHRLSVAAAEAGTEVDARLVADLFADAIAHPESRVSVIMAIADYVLHASSGIVLDLSTWQPPQQ